jgi:hypothetical protein
MSGRKVAELVNKQMNAGVHEAIFIASQGSAVSSGVYLYRLSILHSVEEGSGFFSATRKMVLLK